MLVTLINLPQLYVLSHFFLKTYTCKLGETRGGGFFCARVETGLAWPRYSLLATLPQGFTKIVGRALPPFSVRPELVEG